MEWNKPLNISPRALGAGLAGRYRKSSAQRSNISIFSNFGCVVGIKDVYLFKKVLLTQSKVCVNNNMLWTLTC